MRVGRVEAFAVRYPESNNDGNIRALAQGLILAPIAGASIQHDRPQVGKPAVISNCRLHLRSQLSCGFEHQGAQTATLA